MSKIDRALRLLVAAVLIGLFISRSLLGGWEIVVWIMSIIVITASLVGICTLYKLLEINTGSRKTTA